MTPREKRSGLTQDLLRHIFSYDPDTGVMRWRVSPGKRVSVGAVAGCKTKSGYEVVLLFGSYHPMHRLIWMLVTGLWPKDQIDHINGDPTDNRLKNLREATIQQNVTNRKLSSLSTTGKTGVHYDGRRKTGPWVVQITAKGQRHHLGGFDTLKEAASRLFGEFARVA